MDLFDADTFQPLGTVAGIGDFAGRLSFFGNGSLGVVGSSGNPRFRGGGLTVFGLQPLQKILFVPTDLADNLEVSASDEVFVSTGNRAGIDRLTLLESGTLIRVRSYVLGINRFEVSDGRPRHDDIRRIVVKEGWPP